MTSDFVSSVGLLFDIAGAFFLAESFVLKKRQETLRETRLLLGRQSLSTA